MAAVLTKIRQVPSCSEPGVPGTDDNGIVGLVAGTLGGSLGSNDSFGFNTRAHAGAALPDVAIASLRHGGLEWDVSGGHRSGWTDGVNVAPARN